MRKGRRVGLRVDERRGDKSSRRLRDATSPFLPSLPLPIHLCSLKRSNHHPLSPLHGFLVHPPLRSPRQIHPISQQCDYGSFFQSPIHDLYSQLIHRSLSFPSVPPPQESDLSFHLSEHLRMNGIYWGLTALCMLDRKDALDRDDMIKWVMSCWHEKQGRLVRPSKCIYPALSLKTNESDKHKPIRKMNTYSSLTSWLHSFIRSLSKTLRISGGFSAAPGHDAHALTTLSAIQILIMQDARERLDVERLTSCQSHHVSVSSTKDTSQSGLVFHRVILLISFAPLCFLGLSRTISLSFSP